MWARQPILRIEGRECRHLAFAPQANVLESGLVSDLQIAASGAVAWRTQDRFVSALATPMLSILQGACTIEGNKYRRIVVLSVIVSRYITGAERRVF